MALTARRKPCKLDAICAKLKQINSQEQTKEEDEREVSSDICKPGKDLTAESPTDLSKKCSNNNIIGKADLNKIDDEIIGSNGLDLSKKTKENSVREINGDKEEKTATLKTPPESKPVEKTEKESVISDSKIVTPKSVRREVVVGSGRRKRGIPRSISQVREFYDQVDSKEELADYEINNQNTNFPPDDPYESEKDTVGSGCVSLSHSNEFINDDSQSSCVNHSEALGHSGDSFKSRQSSDYENNDDIIAPLDLSVSHSRDDDDSINGYLSSDEDGSKVADDDDDDFFHPDRNLVIDEGKPSRAEISKSCSAVTSPKCNGSEQAAHLKDYAESTMNELISMYGFGGTSGHHNDVSRQVPLKNFKSIFQHTAPDHLSPGSTRSSVLTSLSNQPMSSGDEESHDSSTSLKGIYANYVNSGAGVSSKAQGKYFPRKLF